MRTLRLTIAYDGTDFAGWQRQPTERTVQGCIEHAFERMVGTPVFVRGAGRTDAGVHANGQVGSTKIETRIRTNGFLLGLNTYLPTDVAILKVEDMPDTFDARLSAQGKVYQYLVWNRHVRSPRHRRDSWHVRAPLDVPLMREAASLFVGEHDFRAFRSSDCDRISTVRRMRRFDVRVEDDGLLCLEVEGTAFLRNMVRIMVGTLVAVGRGGRLRPTDIQRLLTDGDRTRAGVTAPPHGLTLAQVLY